MRDEKSIDWFLLRFIFFCFYSLLFPFQTWWTLISVLNGADGSGRSYNLQVKTPEEPFEELTDMNAVYIWVLSMSIYSFYFSLLLVYIFRFSFFISHIFCACRCNFPFNHSISDTLSHPSRLELCIIIISPHHCSYSFTMWTTLQFLLIHIHENLAFSFACSNFKRYHFPLSIIKECSSTSFQSSSHAIELWWFSLSAETWGFDFRLLEYMIGQTWTFDFVLLKLIPWFFWFLCFVARERI